MFEEIKDQASGEEFPRIGVDLGYHETRLAFLDEEHEVPRILSLPTLLSYSRQEAEPVRFSSIGEKAVERRDHMRLVHPFRSGLEGRGLIL